MHAQYSGCAGAAPADGRAHMTIGPGVSGGNGTEGVSETPLIAQKLTHIDIQLDELYNQVVRICERTSPVCGHNPMELPWQGRENAEKQTQNPSQLLTNLSEKLSRIEHLTEILRELHSQMQI